MEAALVDEDSNDHAHAHDFLVPTTPAIAEADQEESFSFAPSALASDLFPTSIAAESNMDYI